MRVYKHELEQIAPNHQFLYKNVEYLDLDLNIDFQEGQSEFKNRVYNYLILKEQEMVEEKITKLLE